MEGMMYRANQFIVWLDQRNMRADITRARSDGKLSAHTSGMAPVVCDTYREAFRRRMEASCVWTYYFGVQWTKLVQVDSFMIYHHENMVGIKGGDGLLYIGFAGDPVTILDEKVLRHLLHPDFRALVVERAGHSYTVQFMYACNTFIYAGENPALHTVLTEACNAFITL